MYEPEDYVMKEGAISDLMPHIYDTMNKGVPILMTINLNEYDRRSKKIINMEGRTYPQGSTVESFEYLFDCDVHGWSVQAAKNYMLPPRGLMIWDIYLERFV